MVDVLEHNSYLVKMDGCGQLRCWLLNLMVVHSDVLVSRLGGTSLGPEMGSRKKTGMSIRHLNSGQGNGEDV